MSQEPGRESNDAAKDVERDAANDAANDESDQEIDRRPRQRQEAWLRILRRHAPHFHPIRRAGHREGRRLRTLWPAADPGARRRGHSGRDG